MSTAKKLAGLFLLSSALTFPGYAMAQGTGGQPATGAQNPTSPDPEDDDNLAEEVTGIDETGQDDAFEDQPEVSIPGGEGTIITVTGRRGPRDITRSSSQVVNILSAEQIARTGEGDIAGALSRVTGLSDNGDGRVFVRGLGDRYSLALLNGLPLPSPEPLSRVVPLDIFPTSIVASSLVQKTYSANFTGEFGGGLINLTTVAVPDESFLEIGVGISGDTETTFDNALLYYGSDFDWFGFDTGRRDAPPALQAFFDQDQQLSNLTQEQRQSIAKDLISPNLLLIQQTDTARPNLSGGINAGTSFEVGSDGRLGIIATANLSNSLRNRDITAQTPDSADLNIRTDAREFTTDNQINANALLGFGLELGDQQFRLTNLFIRDVLKQAQLSFVEDLQNGDSEVQQFTAWFERQLIDSQLVAELEFGQLDVDIRAGFAQSDRESPYEYTFEYVRTNNENDPFGDLFVNPLNRIRGDLASVAFSDLTEKVYYGGIDVSYPVIDEVTLTVGYAYTDTDRRSERREFIFDSDSNFPQGVALLRPDLLLGDAVIEFYDINLFETTQTFPVFDAELTTHGAYAKAIINPTLNLTMDVGVRYEDGSQTASPVQIFENQANLGAVTSLNNDYFLPAATITYDFDNGLQVRASASKTIARPQFRELIFQPYIDPVGTRQFLGNPALQDGELINAEVRAEYYFDGSNRVSLAGFYKDIDNPIEPYSSFSDNAQITQFANAPAAQLYGAEVEFLYNYSTMDWGGFWESKNLFFLANYTYTNSELQVNADDQTFTFTPGVGAVAQPAANFFFDGAPLTGQSDHLANVQFGIEDEDKLQQLTVLMSYASERVTSRGAGGLPDIVEDPGFRLDLVARQGIELFNVPLELKFTARNITGRDQFEYQEVGDNRIEINSYQVGQSYSLSVSAEF
ncbi:TonB-dependent receptor [Qipengyuania sp. JC766]|uniref:TonB-dependent receptor domain-containing protein n=1 Tax=Qipengyuania sp. JC766 TaxID=3232139 RepID=UPI003459A266